MTRRVPVPLVLAGVSAAGLVGLVYLAQPEHKEVPVQKEQTKHISELANEPVNIEYLLNANGSVKEMKMHFSPEAAQRFSQYVPVWYEIQGANIRFPLPFEDGLRAGTPLKTATLKPKMEESYDGKELIIFGTEPRTRSPVELYRRTLNSRRVR